MDVKRIGSEVELEDEKVKAEGVRESDDGGGSGTLANKETKEGGILTEVCPGDLEKDGLRVRRTQSENKKNPGN